MNVEPYVGEWGTPATGVRGGFRRSLTLRWALTVVELVDRGADTTAGASK